jgi:signal transduction histidine kinase
MGSRSRSIRLRIYFLVAIPLVTMLGLFAYVANTSISNYTNLDRAPTLIQTTSTPMSSFMDTLQAERRAAVVYQAAPTTANKGTYESAINTTDSMNPSPNGPHGLGYLMQAIDAPATKQAASSTETASITKLLGALTGSTLQNLRAGVSANAIAPKTAFVDYTNLIEGILQVFQSEAGSMTNATAATQGLGLIETIQEREDIDEQDALLAGALASGTLTTDERVGFEQAAGREDDDQALYTNTLSSTEVAAFNDGFNSYDNGLAASLDQRRLTIQEGVEAGYPLTALEALGLSSATWQQINATVAAANFQAGTAAADASLAHDQGIANSAHRTVYVTAGVGIIGLILSLLLTIVLARSINRRLTRLRRQALVLAQEQLPSVVSRLRRGEAVDVAAEAPTLRIGGDEIGQVGQAFDAVRQTAIASAVEEARLRQGVNDVFRNLARRSQSLLQRQLTTLDQMERRATDPEALDDLFKLDHLTTRMRRHAEGLIILSGAPPGRGWSAPVRIIDVLRGAVSEVEDYARVQVNTQSKAALSGSAVTDVIHLLAELIENATSLSPPYTQVRVTGEPATNGFAIEIEDRGLGMKAERLAELNDRLANPPDVNPANTEQLGLFVVAKLASRHGIQVTLRTSPYGGTSAVALIPRRLVVDDVPAALTSGENPAIGPGSADSRPSTFSLSGAGSGNGASLNPGPGNGNGFASREPAGAGRNGGGSYGSGQYGADRAGAGQYGPSQGSAGQGSAGQYGADRAGAGADQYGAGQYGGGQAGANPYGARPYSASPASQYGTGQYQQDGDSRDGAGSPPDLDTIRLNSGFMPGTGRPGGYSRVGQAVTGGQPTLGNGSQRGRHSDEIPVVTGIPVSRDAAPPFDVFTPVSRAGGGQDFDANEPESEITSYRDASYGKIEGAGEGYGSGGTDAGEVQGLPRRVRQANLAPQLRNTGTRAAGTQGAVPPASAASLTDMRSTLSAMQRGWQQGRSQSAQPDTEGNPNGA